MPAQLPPVATRCETPYRNPKTSALPTCPVCGGDFVPLRGALRCCRCYFSLCEGCEGGAADNSVGTID